MKRLTKCLYIIIGISLSSASFASPLAIDNARLDQRISPTMSSPNIKFNNSLAVNTGSILKDRASKPQVKSVGSLRIIAASNSPA